MSLPLPKNKAVLKKTQSDDVLQRDIENNNLTRKLIHDIFSFLDIVGFLFNKRILHLYLSFTLYYLFFYSYIYIYEYSIEFKLFAFSLMLNTLTSLNFKRTCTVNNKYSVMRM